jgi:hypothetical protein
MGHTPYDTAHYSSCFRNVLADVYLEERDRVGGTSSRQRGSSFLTELTRPLTVEILNQSAGQGFKSGKMDL